jgi:isopentenyl phosphate kinase
MDTTKVKEYVCLERRKKDLSAELKQVEHDLKDLERVVIDQLVNAGLDEVGADGRTLKLKPCVYISPVEGRYGVIEALKDAGLDQFIPPNYNDAQLRSFVEEIASGVRALAKREDRLATAEEIRAALPEPLARALTVIEGYKLSSTKS